MHRQTMHRPLSPCGLGSTGVRLRKKLSPARWQRDSPIYADDLLNEGLGKQTNEGAFRGAIFRGSSFQAFFNVGFKSDRELFSKGHVT